MRTFESLSILDKAAFSIDAIAWHLGLRQILSAGTQEKGDKRGHSADWAGVCAAGTPSLFGSPQHSQSYNGRSREPCPRVYLNCTVPFCRDTSQVPPAEFVDDSGGGLVKPAEPSYDPGERRLIRRNLTSRRQNFDRERPALHDQCRSHPWRGSRSSLPRGAPRYARSRAGDTAVPDKV